MHLWLTSFLFVKIAGCTVAFFALSVRTERPACDGLNAKSKGASLCAWAVQMTADNTWIMVNMANN